MIYKKFSSLITEKILLLCVYKLQAIENGFSMDYSGFGKEEKEKYGSLVSDLFEKHWEQKVGKEPDFERIFNMVQTWPPLKQFIIKQCKFTN